MMVNLLNYILLISLLLLYITGGIIMDEENQDVSFNKYIIAIKPKKTLKEDRDYSASFEIRNIGWSEILINMTRCSDLENNINIYEVLNPGQNLFIPKKYSYHTTKYTIANNMDTRAIIYFYGEEYHPKENCLPSKYDNICVLQDTFNLGVKYIPKLDRGLDALLSHFWLGSKISILDQFYKKIKPLLTIIQKKIIAAAVRDFRYIKEMLKNLNDNQGNRSKAYIQLAQELLNFECKFILTSSIFTTNEIATNFYTLPLYSSIVTMKIHFYAMGFAKSNIFQLNEKQQLKVLKYASKTLYGREGAINYVTNIYKYAIEEIYDRVCPGALYNVMMTARSYIALHGLELLPVWHKEYTTQGSEENPYINVISYSSFYGTASPNLFKQATLIEESSLIPPLGLNKERLKLISIELYKHPSKNQPHVSGIKLIYEDNYMTLMGTVTKNVQLLDLNKITITKLTVYGGSYVQGLTFTLSDGTIRHFGLNNNNRPKEFQLKDHHIISLYVESEKNNNMYLANVAVSFLQNPLTK